MNTENFVSVRLDKEIIIVIDDPSQPWHQQTIAFVQDGVTLDAHLVFRALEIGVMQVSSTGETWKIVRAPVISM